MTDDNNGNNGNEIPEIHIINPNLRQRSEVFAEVGRMNQVLGTAIALIKSEMQTIDYFLSECQRMDNVGSILTPSVYNDPVRKKNQETMQPILEAAKKLVNVFDAKMKEFHSKNG